MSARLTRRDLLKTTALGMGAAAASRVLEMPYILADPAPAGDKAKLRIAVIGCGGRGVSSHIVPAARERLVAVVDPDSKRIENALNKAKEEPGVDPATIRTFSDYRKFFDVMAKEVDAVIIATPNHHHALPALLAMQNGIAPFVEKPMAHNVSEGRMMAEFARKYKVPTQMGNQGHSGEGYRRLCEYIWAGAIGNVTEVYHWTNRANGGTGLRPAPQPVPANLDWDQWIGPAPYREFHTGLHPHSWHNWHDFGNGSLGNMAAHIMDGAFWALKLGKPSAIQVEEIIGGSVEKQPVGTRVRWDYPARGDMAPVKVFWYDGKRTDVVDPGKGTVQGSVSRQIANVPPIMEEMIKQTGLNFDGDGTTFYVGDKGIMYTGCYGGGVTILPVEKMKEFPVPPQQIPRIKNSHLGDFFDAVRGGPEPNANFEYATPFNETILLGNLAIRAALLHGVGTKIEWDSANMRVTNLPELNQYVKPAYREGWRI